MAAKAATLRRRATKTRSPWVKRVKRFFAVAFLLVLVGVVVGGIYFMGELRHASELMVSLPDKLKTIDAKPTRIVSADGQVLYTVESEFREPVKLADIPQVVRDAIVAAEDKRFYEHGGVDYEAIVRSAFVGAKEGRFSQGGSTLTMQLAKRFYSEGQKTVNRKLQDIALAIEMEREMTKDQILELYLNTMYFGEKAYGIRAAADVYFGKPLDKLTIAEAAMLARCVRRPSDENPVKNLPKAVDNRNVVLAIMRDQKMITDDQYEEAIAEKVHLAPPKERITSHLNKAQYFVDHVLQTVAQDMPDLDLKQGGYTIYTTLDTRLEDYAERVVRDFVREHRGDDVNDAAFVVMDKDGKILAEVGGVDYRKDQFNIITQGLLQPGSSFKPFLYATALSSGALSMNDELDNEPFTYPGTENWRKPWRPQDSSPREMSGPVSVERAMASSLNIPAAHVMERVGPDAVADFAHGAFGFRSEIARVPSLALGACQVHPLEMAEGYSVFMLRGSRATPYVITKIVDADGQVLRTYDPDIIPNQLDPTVCDDIDSLLKAVVDRGTAASSGIDEIPDARGKTGTTSDHKDGWFCGYTDGLVGVGWIGNNV
ncbi:MAG TPA: transglycosylase domain-containing protein, partial [Fimbriimonadaceae bacterium]|nr:transglycosylase domain-containing protein [Fimbriimonadaceae bacterium]